MESVKAASDAFCPATGKVLEVNTVGVVCDVSSVGSFGDSLFGERVPHGEGMVHEARGRFFISEA